MKFVGHHNHTVCLEHGNWSNPLPQCLAPCIVPHVKHADSIYTVQTDLIANNRSEITLNEVRPGNFTSHGSYLEIVCDCGYDPNERMDENITQPVCNNSTWSYKPLCLPASCKSAPENPKNGRVRVGPMEHGSKGYVQCLDGYRLKGDNVTHCINGKWEPIRSNCLEIYCRFPGVIDNGRVLLVGLTGTTYDYKPYIKRISNNRQINYECDKGYRLNDSAPSAATCIDGHWRPEGLPTCLGE